MSKIIELGHLLTDTKGPLNPAADFPAPGGESV